MTDRIDLSPPHIGRLERSLVEEAFDSNWIAPAGPHLEAFEREFCERTGAASAVAVSSGTAALHLALMLAGVGPGDEVFVSTLTFAASAFPVRYLGARPSFIDSERRSWNMDPDLLDAALEERSAAGSPPAAVVLVHLYGQCADLTRIERICRRHRVPLIEDAAEALGATHESGKQPGTIGDFGAFSFNGNKIITTAGGGMLVARDTRMAERARKLATQAREPVLHYEHEEIGFNYRLSNVLAAIGRGQLRVLDRRIEARRGNFARYMEELGGLPGICFMPEASWGRHTRWLTTLTVDEAAFGASRDDLLDVLIARRIEARPVWKPMHRQPVFAGCERVGGGVADDLFARGICLPSGSDLTAEQLVRIGEVIRGCRTGSGSGRFV